LQKNQKNNIKTEKSNLNSTKKYEKKYSFHPSSSFSSSFNIPNIISNKNSKISYDNFNEENFNVCPLTYINFSKLNAVGKLALRF
jgi:hypothetical protein